MGKGSSAKHTKHNLLLRGGEKTYFGHKTVIDYSPKSNGYVRAAMASLISTLPTFNFDSKFFTPGFQVPYLGVDEQHYKQKHQRKLHQHDEIDQSEIMVPKPRNKDYCHVCGRHFQDYLEHVFSQMHHQVIKTNFFQKQIRKLCRKYRKVTIKNNEEEKGESDEEGSVLYQSKQEQQYLEQKEKSQQSPEFKIQQQQQVKTESKEKE